jgi:hypothetical protein
MKEMEIEQNMISRDWTVLHEGRRFFVNFTESDGQTLALCNRDNWQIHEETEESIEELSPYVLRDSRPEERELAEEKARTMEKLIAFCIANWDNGFMRELEEKLEEQRKAWEG